MLRKSQIFSFQSIINIDFTSMLILYILQLIFFLNHILTNHNLYILLVCSYVLF